MTHKLENKYITEVLPQEWEFWAPHQAPQAGGLASGGGAPRAFGFESQRGLGAGVPQDWGKQRLHSRRMHTRFHVHWDLGQSSDSIGDWARPTCRSWRVYWWGEGWLWLTVGIRTLVAETPELITVSSPEGHHFGTKTWPHPTACSLQCWDTSGQTTNRVGTQPHPSTNKLPKVVLNPQLPLNTLLDTALSTRGTKPSSTHQWAGTSPTHQEACTSPWTKLTHQGADTRSKRNYSPAVCRTETTNTES